MSERILSPFLPSLSTLVIVKVECSDLFNQSVQTGKNVLVK